MKHLGKCINCPLSMKNDDYKITSAALSAIFQLAAKLDHYNAKREGFDEALLEVAQRLERLSRLERVEPTLFIEKDLVVTQKELATAKAFGLMLLSIFRFNPSSLTLLTLLANQKDFLNEEVEN